MQSKRKWGWRRRFGGRPEDPRPKMDSFKGEALRSSLKAARSDQWLLLVLVVREQWS